MSTQQNIVHRVEFKFNTAEYCMWVRWCVTAWATVKNEVHLFPEIKMAVFEFTVTEKQMSFSPLNLNYRTSRLRRGPFYSSLLCGSDTEKEGWSGEIATVFFRQCQSGANDFTLCVLVAKCLNRSHLFQQDSVGRGEQRGGGADGWRQYERMSLIYRREGRLLWLTGP